MTNPKKQEAPSEQRHLVESLMALVRGQESTRDFWRQYLHHVTALCGGKQALLAARVGDQWKTLAVWTPFSPAWEFGPDLDQAATMALAQGIVAAQTATGVILAFRIDVGPQEQPPVALVDLGPGHPDIPSDSTLFFAAALPSTFQVMRQYRQTRADLVFFAELMQLVGTVGDDQSFRLAAMRLCNETATLLQCSQISLGWRGDRSMRVRAISHLDQFEQNSGTVRELEAAMDECADQDAEILWPAPTGKASPLTRAHESYAGIRRVGSLLSLPLRRDQAVVGVLTCERQDQPFREEEAWRLRLLLELCARRFWQLAEGEGWFGARLWRRTQRWLGRQLRIEGAGWKLATGAALITCGMLFVDLWPYAVEGPFMLKADDAVSVTAAQNGSLQTVNVAPGDLVAAGEPLVVFDSRELLTEQSATLARLARYYREAEKAKAGNALAEMRVSLLLAKETEAELERIAYDLENTKVVAPFAGVVVEGDLRARIGSPVRQGDVLMKIASLRQLSPRISIDESEIDEIAPGAAAEVTFVSRPDLRYPIRLSKIIPSAEVESGRNIFAVEGELIDPPQSWWRPGMSGMARIHLGRRSLWWLLTHDLMDFLYLKFWL